jgi:DNA-directed RNA polymerase subunit K/omega
MSDTVDLNPPEPVPEPEAAAPVRVAPIESRFLFVDIAAMRAKQLRRGARVRLNDDDGPDQHRAIPHKAERVAMEEVRRGLVNYEVPANPVARP